MIHINGKIATDNLVLCYDFGNIKSYPGSGSTVTDLSRVGATGTLINTPTFSSTNGGQITLNGTTQYITSNRPSQLITGGPITICIWVKWTTSVGIQALVDNNHSSGNGFVMQERGDLGGDPTVFTTVPAGTGIGSNVALGNGQWVLITGTNDTVASRLYINGNLNGSFTEAGLSTVQPTLTMGYWQGVGRYLNGSIGSVRLYNRALTATEVKQNYDALKMRFGLQ